MPYRLSPFITGGYYHVYARGNNKQNIVSDVRDYARLLFCILFFQARTSPRNVGRYVNYYFRNGMYDATGELTNHVHNDRNVHVLNFAILPNHLHITVHQNVDGGISKYMERVLQSHARYLNKKTDSVGHVFQGSFGSVHISDENYLSYLSAYIHRNCSDVTDWNGMEDQYPWSSYYDYIHQNRWGSMILPEPVLDLFSSPAEYQRFVESSGAKEIL